MPGLPKKPVCRVGEGGTDSTLLSTGATARLRSKHACEAQMTHKYTHAQVMDKVHIGPDSAHTRHVDPARPLTAV